VDADLAGSGHGCGPRPAARLHPGRSSVVEPVCGPRSTGPVAATGHRPGPA
jgi:hypothetical protein